MKRLLYNAYGGIGHGRLGCPGHVVKRTVLKDDFHRPSRVGRPRLRWADGPVADTRSLLSIRNLKAVYRTEPNGGALLRRPRLTPGCRACMNGWSLLQSQTICFALYCSLLIKLYIFTKLYIEMYFNICAAFQKMHLLL